MSKLSCEDMFSGKGNSTETHVIPFMSEQPFNIMISEEE
jgi:hypothetical protein